MLVEDYSKDRKHEREDDDLERFLKVLHSDEEDCLKNEEYSAAQVILLALHLVRLSAE